MGNNRSKQKQRTSNEECEKKIDRMNNANSILKEKSTKTINNALRFANLSVDDFTFLSVTGGWDSSYGLRLGMNIGSNICKIRKNDDNEIYTIKSIKRRQVSSQNDDELMSKNRRIIYKVKNPFIVSIEYLLQKKGNEKIYFVCNEFTGAELIYYLQKEGQFTEQQSIFYSAQIFLGLKYLHSIDIIYGDLRSNNIVLDFKGNIKITDFNGLTLNNSIDGDEYIILNDDQYMILTKRYSPKPIPNEIETIIYEYCKDDVLYHSFSTISQYSAPELLNNKQITKATDWWSFGVILYEMMSSSNPFYDENIKIMIHNIQNGRIPLNCFNKQSQSLFAGILQPNINTRFEEKDIQQHQFYKSVDWNSL